MMATITKATIDMSELAAVSDADLSAQIDARFPKPATTTDADLQQAFAMMNEKAVRAAKLAPVQASELVADEAPVAEEKG